MIRRSARRLALALASLAGAASLLGSALALAAPAAAAPAGVAAPAAAPSGAGPLAASVDDFRFSSFHSDFLLGRDEAGHATLRVTETLVAEFPQADQNRGIRRAIPDRYRDHPVELRVLSVTDEHGTPRPFETESDDGITVLTIRADRYLHGAQHYVITYTEKNVVLFPDDSDAPEFYWDVNGTGWLQPFDRVSATLTVEEALVPSVTGTMACYQGPEGATTPCDELARGEGRTVLTAAAEALAPGEGLTIAARFAPGSFVPRDDSYLASGFAVPQLAAGVLAVLGLLAALIGRVTAWRDAPGRGIVIAEYEPPPGVGPLLASTVAGTASKATAAAMLDLAVHGHVRVVDLGRKRGYRLELVDPAGARGETMGGLERELAQALFGDGLAAGAHRDLKKTDTALGKRLQALRSRMRAAALDSGYRRRSDGPLRVAGLVASVAGAAGAVGFGVGVLAGEVGEGAAFGVIAVGIASCVAALAILFRRPLTREGALLREHLEGLGEYIRLAEADRLRVLQSPSGALRSGYAPQAAPSAVPGPAQAGATPLDEAEVLRLNERLLPYAVLLGYEKEWSAALGDAYERLGRPPEWYEGTDSFTAVAFASTVHSFSSSVASTWSGSASSSGSSGSGGGGSSGGGGGGGGGGGV